MASLGGTTHESYVPLIMFLQASFCQVGVIHCKWIKDADTVVIGINCFVCDLLNQSRLGMVHQMCEAHFVNTSQIKDNLLIYSQSFFQTRKNSLTTHLFYLFIYLFVLQWTSHNNACRKNVLFFFLSKFFTFSFELTKKKKKKTMQIYLFILN